MAWEWLGASLDILLLVAISTFGAYFWVIVLTRIAGLRSFAKMSAFDFTMTVAVGTLIASTAASREPQLLRAVVVLALLYGIQASIAYLRIRSQRMKNVVDNAPLLLMAGSEMIQENMRAARVAENDLWAKIREANVTNLSHLIGVVMESTGTISVLHAPPGSAPLNPRILSGVRGSGRLLSKL
jgi:uncharacterized membrane protein YcaP (DUF421 family)